MKLGTIIEMYTSEHGYSMRAFAKICDISPSQLSFMVRGINSDKKPSTPRPETLVKLAAGMGITYKELLNALDEETRVMIGTAGNETAVSSEKQAAIDKIILSTPEQFALIKNYIDFVMK